MRFWLTLAAAVVLAATASLAAMAGHTLTAAATGGLGLFAVADLLARLHDDADDDQPPQP